MEQNSETVLEQIDKALEDAFSGQHEVFLREDDSGLALDGVGMPVCRFERWSDAGGNGIPASSGWQLSADQTGTFLCLALAQQETLALIDKLREEEGDSVTIVSDNADFNGQPNCLITCMGDWTGYTDLRFAADTVLDCLRAAVAEKERGVVREPVIEPASVTILVGEYEALLLDKGRLDFLDLCGRVVNADSGTLYGWRLIRSHNVTRVMMNSPYGNEAHAVDLNDANAVGTCAGGVLSVRLAIDGGVANFYRDHHPAEDHTAVDKLVAAKLMQWSRDWILDGDVVRCRNCKRGICWSRRGESLNHQAECPQKKGYPWALLTALPVVEAANPIPAIVAET